MKDKFTFLLNEKEVELFSKLITSLREKQKSLSGGEEEFIKRILTPIEVGYNRIAHTPRERLIYLYGKLKEPQKDFFKRLYLNTPDKIPSAKIPTATRQCERTIKKNKNEKSN